MQQDLCPTKLKAARACPLRNFSEENCAATGRVAIWPFLNYLPEIEWFGHLAIFWPSLNVIKS